jgi:hypothetical protein
MLDGILGVSTAAVAVAAIVGLVMFGVSMRDAWRATADARVAHSDTSAKLAIAQATITTLSDTLATEKRRADALDDALHSALSDPDPATARERVLARWQIDRATAAPGPAASGAAGPVPPQPLPVAKPGPITGGLLKPGE